MTTTLLIVMILLSLMSLAATAFWSSRGGFWGYLMAGQSFDSLVTFLTIIFRILE